jgi:hypothetical protein
MLAALARQMDVDVLISGGTHRCVRHAERFQFGDEVDSSWCHLRSTRMWMTTLRGEKGGAQRRLDRAGGGRARRRTVRLGTESGTGHWAGADDADSRHSSLKGGSSSTQAQRLEHGAGCGTGTSARPCASKEHQRLQRSSDSAAPTSPVVRGHTCSLLDPPGVYEASITHIHLLRISFTVPSPWRLRCRASPQF